MSKRRALALGVVTIAAVALGWWRLGTRVVPAGQPPLVTLTAANIEVLRDDFNSAVGEVRILTLLSPT